MDVLLDDARSSAIGSRILNYSLNLINLVGYLDSLSLIGIFTGLDDPNVFWRHLGLVVFLLFLLFAVFDWTLSRRPAIFLSLLLFLSV